jgi:hypothetical protein
MKRLKQALKLDITTTVENKHKFSIDELVENVVAASMELS